MDLSCAGDTPAGDFFKMIQVTSHKDVIGAEACLCY